MTRQGGAAVETVHCIELAVVLPLRGRERHAAPLQTPLVHIVLTAVCTDAGKARSSLPKFSKFYHSTPQDGMQA